MWRMHVLYRNNNLTFKHLAFDDDRWKMYALCNDENKVEKHFQTHNLMKRLVVENNNDFLRLNVRIVQPYGDPVIWSKMVLNPKIFKRADGVELIIASFSHFKQNSVLYWKGEGGKYSRLQTYAIDRRQPGKTIPLFETFIRPRIVPLNRRQLREIGKFLNNRVYDTSTVAVESWYFVTITFKLQDLLKLFVYKE
jgi:hypothetical protein